MSKMLELSDEQYRIISEAARAAGRTPEELFLQWTLDEESRYRHANPTYRETDDWLRHLGVSEERIQRADAIVGSDEGTPDAHS